MGSPRIRWCVRGELPCEGEKHSRDPRLVVRGLRKTFATEVLDTMADTSTTLHVRWLGRVPYVEALAVQDAMFRHGTGNRLLLMEHPHVFTYGPSADLK